MKKRKTIFVIILLSVLVLLISACKPGAQEPVYTEEDLQRQVLETQSARATQFAVETMAAQLTALSMPTFTPIPTEIPTQAPTPTQVPPTAVVAPVEGSPTPAPAQPTNPPATQPTNPPAEKQCYAMELISETIPSGTTMKPGEKFDKSWTIKNTGTCAWTKEFDIALSGGEAFGSNKLGDIKDDVLPGETVTVTLYELVSPQTPGTYYSYWVVKALDGTRFGYGPNGAWGLGITIEVKKP